MLVNCGLQELAGLKDRDVSCGDFYLFVGAYVAAKTGGALLDVEHTKTNKVYLLTGLKRRDDDLKDCADRLVTVFLGWPVLSATAPTSSALFIRKPPCMGEREDISPQHIRVRRPMLALDQDHRLRSQPVP